MIDRAITMIEALIHQYGSWGVFVAAITEEVLAPIPSGIVMMSSGYAFLAGEAVSVANLLYLVIHVALPLCIGLTIGSLLVYGLTYKYGEVIIKKFGKYIGLHWSDVMRLHNKFDKTHKDELTLLILRSLPILPSVAINAVAGMVRMPLRPYIVATLAGTFIRALAVSFIGWQVGNVYKKYADIVDRFEKIGLALLLGLPIAFVIYRKFKSSK